MLILRQSTSIDIRMGPFVDATDGVTPETTVTLAGADQAEVLKANGAATVAMAGTFAAVTGADGWYDYTCAAGDVDTVGEVVFVVQDLSLCLPVYVRGYVVEEAVYDAMYGAASAGPLQSTTAGRTLDVSATGEAGIDWANIGSPTTAQNLSGTNIDVDQVVASVSGAVGSVTGAVGSVTAAVTIDAGSVDAIWDETLTAHVTADSAAVALKDVLNDTGTSGVIVATNNDKTGYSLTQAFPTNFADMAITVTTGQVTVGTNNDKTGYSISGAITTLDGLNDLSATEVNAEMVDVMNVDTITLPGQTAPPLAPTHRQAIGWLYKVLRNRKSQTASQWTLYADDETTVDAKATVSDDGTTAIKQEIVTGP